MRYSDKQLLDRVQSLPSFKGWPNGILDIWVRSKADQYNAFDDKVYTYDCTSGQPVFQMVCTGTSHSGAFGLLYFKKWNRRGCAVLCTDILVYDCYGYGLHKGKPAYRQIKNFPYTRDNDKDKQSENYGTILNGIIGANCHRAGFFSTVIANWSVACLVRNRLSEFLKWLSFMNRRSLSVVVLKEF